LPTEAYVDAAERCPAASVDTARYSTSVPAASPATSWCTAGSVSSAVPSGCHWSEPTTRHAKLVCRHESSAAAATRGLPPRPAPGSGAETVSSAAEAGAVTVSSARRTTADSAATVTETAPAGSLVALSGVPYSGVKPADAVSAGIVTVWGEAVLFRATRCSTFSSASTRENA
jgi:hypothetical protein